MIENFKMPRENEPNRPVSKEQCEAQKAFRQEDAKAPMTEQETAEKAFSDNRERLRSERLAREAVQGPMLNPAPELPDDIPIENVRLPSRIRNALTWAGLKTVGEIREAPDATLLSLQDLGKTSVTHLRETLGLPSTDGVRPGGGVKGKQ
jgi:DNA-directed RNA polymerase alpha subunit